MQTKIIAGALMVLTLNSACLLDQTNSKEAPYQKEREQLVLSLVNETLQPNYLAGGNLNWVEPAGLGQNSNPVFTTFPVKVKWNRHHSDPSSQVEVFCNQNRLFYHSLLNGDLYLMDGIAYQKYLKQPTLTLSPNDHIAIVPNHSQCQIKVFEANQRKELKAVFRIELPEI